MSQFDNLSFDTFMYHFFRLYQDQQYAEALEYATHAQPYLLDDDGLLRMYRACISACLGDAAQTLALLEEAHALGYWYSDRHWEDTDFDTVRDLPEFKRQRAISAERRAAAQARARPELLVRLPDDAVSGPVPLLLAMHGNNTSLAKQGDHWRPAAEQGWLVGFAQSSQVGDHTGYVWNDVERTDRELCRHFDALVGGYPVDRDRVVLGGFSLGGETAVRLALSGTIQVCGFIAVAPGGPLCQQPELWQPVIDAAQQRDLRGYVILGGQDIHTQLSLRLVEMLRAAGFTCELEEHADLGHAFPPDFAARLDQILAFVLGA